MPAYVPLWCKSNFSFLEGASHPAELVTRAYALGLPALALTDRDGVQGIVRAHVQAKSQGLPLIVGSEVTVSDGSTLVLLAKNRTGYTNLCRLATEGRRRAPKGEAVVEWGEISGHADGLLALWGGAHSLLVRKEEPIAAANALREAFGDRLYALVARHRQPEERQQEALLRARAERWRLPLVATTEVLYHLPQRRPLQDILT